MSVIAIFQQLLAIGHGLSPWLDLELPQAQDLDRHSGLQLQTCNDLRIDKRLAQLANSLA
jgi:hypothetical protein